MAGLCRCCCSTVCRREKAENSQPVSIADDHRKRWPMRWEGGGISGEGETQLTGKMLGTEEEDAGY